jgi:hypothetical protein
MTSRSRGDWPYFLHVAKNRRTENVGLAAIERNRNAALKAKAEAPTLVRDGRGASVRVKANRNCPRAAGDRCACGKLVDVHRTSAYNWVPPLIWNHGSNTTGGNPQ